jgi:triosephosphate isomerase (TIM)
MLILNLKNYEEGRGDKLELILDEISRVIKDTDNTYEKIFVAVSTPYLAFARYKYPDISIIAQHVDFQNVHNSTGWITPDNLLSLGINYSIYNHAEHRVFNEEIFTAIEGIQQTGVKLIVACESIKETTELLQARPYGIAFEDKKLIGSGQSITNHKSEEIKQFIQICKGKTKMVIGAGISSQSDIQAGLDFGAEGFILASAFVKALDHKQKLKELIQPLL